MMSHTEAKNEGDHAMTRYYTMTQPETERWDNDDLTVIDEIRERLGLEDWGSYPSDVDSYEIHTADGVVAEVLYPQD